MNLNDRSKYNLKRYNPRPNHNIIQGSLQQLFWMEFRKNSWSKHTQTFFKSLKRSKRSKKSIKKSAIFLMQSFVIIPLLFFATLLPFYIFWRFYFSDTLMYVISITDCAFAVRGLLIGGLVSGLMSFLFWFLIWPRDENFKYFLQSRLLADAILGGAFTYSLSIFYRGLDADKNLYFLSAYIFLLILSITFPVWRQITFTPIFQIWNFAVYRFDNREDRVGRIETLLPYNSAFWDEFQHFRSKKLDKHMVLVASQSRVEFEAASRFLSKTYQGWAIVSARVEVALNILERCLNAYAISDISSRDSNDKTSQAFIKEALGESLYIKYLADTSKIVNRALNYNESYRERLAVTQIIERLEKMLRGQDLSTSEFERRFYKIANSWRDILASHIDQVKQRSISSNEVDNPYVFGVPIVENQNIFIARVDIAQQLEQLILDLRRPPLLLYGQRRMGKTSLLNNLGRLLPNSIIPLFIDLQGPATRAKDEIGFLYNLARGIITSAQRQSAITLPPLSRETLTDDPFTTFDEWLDQVETTLGDNTALLALDEFEALDAAFDKGNLDESAILGTLRNLIQHRPRFKVLLSGSHTLQEFQRWASYLINAQTIKISYLTEAETRKLIENPIPDFALRYDPDASNRALALTRGHPALTQLLCSEIVNLKNEQDPAVRRQATLTDVNAAIPEALQSGSMFFADLEQNQITANATVIGGSTLLRHLAAQGESIPSPDGITQPASLSHSALAVHFQEHHPDADFDAALELLLRREVIEIVPQTNAEAEAKARSWVFEQKSQTEFKNLREKPGFSTDDEPRYKFQVELIRQWFLR